MPRKLFEKGNPGGPGRPEGSKDKAYLRPEYWHDLVLEQWGDLTASERATVAMRGFCTVLPKTLGPQSPDDSVKNVESAVKILQMLQEVSRNGTNPGISATGYTTGMDNGRPAAQAQSSPAPSL